MAASAPGVDPFELARLRLALSDLDRRRTLALARVAGAANAVARRHLEAMKFELAEAAWVLDELESALLQDHEP